MNRGYVVCLEDYCSILLLSYSISSGALGSPDLLLSHLIISLACHISIILISTLKHCIITTTGTTGSDRKVVLALSKAWARELLDWQSNQLLEYLILHRELQKGLEILLLGW